MTAKRKTIEVNVFDEFLMFDSNNAVGGFIHPRMNSLFVVAPEYIKHELFEIRYRDAKLGIFPHCKDAHCFGSTGKPQKKYSALCGFHSRMCKIDFEQEYRYTINPIIFSDEGRFEILADELETRADSFSRKMQIPVKVNEAVRKDRCPEKNCFIVVNRNNYEYRGPDFSPYQDYKRLMKMNETSLAPVITTYSLESISEHGSLNEYLEKGLPLNRRDFYRLS